MTGATGLPSRTAEKDLVKNGALEYNFGDVFSLRSNIPYFEDLLRAFRTNDHSKRAGISLGFFMDNGLRVLSESKYRVNMMLYYDPCSGTIEFSYPWFRRICAKLSNGAPTQFDFSFNKNYLRLSNVIAEGWELIDIFRSLLLMSLIRSRMYMIHGGAVEINQQGILIPSFGNTGKTTTTWMLARKGAKFLTDEFAILDRDGHCLGFPCSSLVSSALAEEMGLRLSTLRRARLSLNEFRSKLVSTRFAPGGIKLFPDQFFETLDKTLVDKVVFIQNGEDLVKEIDRDRAISMIGAIQSYELNWKANPYVLTHSYFGSSPSTEEISEMEKKIIEDQMSRMSRFYTVSAQPGRHHEAVWKLAK